MESNRHLEVRISMIWATTVGCKGDYNSSTTELDSHANMIVLGEQATIINRSGKYAEVRAFSNECSTLEKVPIVDAVIAYECPYTMKVYLLIARNALHIPSMQHNLIPPFIMREAGLVVNDVPRIHCGEDVTRESHSIIDEESGFRIPLRLRGIFSCFDTRKVTPDEIDNCNSMDAIYLSPDSPTWEPHSEVYSTNEDTFLDDQGEMVYPRQYKKRKLVHDEDVKDAEVYEITASGDDWEAAIDAVLATNEDILGDEFDVNDVAFDQDDPIRAQVADLTGVLDEDILSKAFEEHRRDSQFAMAAGCTLVGDMQSCDAADDALFLPLHLVEPTEADIILDMSATHAEKPKGVTADHISKIWRISEEEAKRTLEVTTQLSKQDAESTLSRNFGTNDRALRYRRINSMFFMDTFFVTAKAKSVRGYTMMQLFVSDKGFMKVYGMTSTSQIPQAQRLFCKEVGVPNAFVCDPHAAQKSKEVRAFCHKIGSTLRVLEERTQHANRAELYIGLIKEGIRKDMRASNSPLVLWCYAAERKSNINNLTAKSLFQLQGQTPHFATFGEMGDISNLCQWGWYEWVYFRQGKAKFPHLTEVLGRCLGPCKNEGNEMCQAILQQNGQIVPRRSLRRLTAHELSVTNEAEASKRANFDAAITKKLGDSMTVVKVRHPRHHLRSSTPQDDYDRENFVPYEDEEVSPAQPMEADVVGDAGMPINTDSLQDLLVNAEVLLPHGEASQMAKVVRKAVDGDGKLIGSFDKNPILNSLVYEVEFPDGVMKSYAANIIAENILYQVDSHGRHHHVMEGILDYRKDNSALTKANAFITTKRGQRKLRQTTIGWHFKVQWKDGSSQWVPLKLLKESNPVEVAEFVQASGVEDEPAFAWWVPYTLRKRDRIIAAVNSRVKKRTHKYGIEVPTSVAHAMKVDETNGDTFWRDAIAKEMFNIGVAFKILENGEILPVGYTKATGHMVFDVKMDFTRKARWVKDGHRTPDPEESTYAGVVSRESIRIMLLHAALNGIDILAADIRNAYLQAPSSEKHFIICGPEFGEENVGKRALIVRALYGGKISGADFWHHLRSCMEDQLGFESCLADPDVWRREATRKDGSKYWEYVLLYVDDVLVISDNAGAVIEKEIGRFWELKEESIGPPSQYLGGHLRQAEMPNGIMAWVFGSSKYVQDAVNNVETYLKKKGESLPAKAKTPLSNGYRPEIDTSDELGPQEASYYQSLIGILRWMVELGRVDMCVEVSMMSSHLALPRKGHLEQVIHIFGYLKKHHNAEMPFDPTEPDIDMSRFERQDWSKSVYGVIEEELPENMPEPHGLSMKMTVKVDADHAGESLTRRSRTGYIVFLNKAPIYWLSKKQTSCETSTFGSEFVAMKQAMEYVRGLRYKLRMFGIPVDEPAFVYGDNQSVLANTTNPSSQLKKKSNSIAYHFVREGTARDEWRTTYCLTHDNTSDLMTKPLPSGEKRSKFVGELLWWL